jgi:tight adherence protein C
VIGVLMAGALLGAGVWLILAGVAPARMPLEVAVARLARTGRPPTRTADDSLAARLGRLILPRAGRQSWGRPTLAADLAVVGRPLEVHVGQKALAGVVGLVYLPAMTALARAAGLDIGWLIPLWLGLVCAVAGFFLPDAVVAARAAERRRDFRHSLAAFIDLVVMLLAASEGPTGALELAARSGDSWPFAELRRVFADARATRHTPWAGLRDLGDRYGIDELVELAASVELGGGDTGAAVRRSLIAKASTLRTHQLAEEEAAAESASSQMVLPMLGLVMAFTLFLGYAAGVGVVNSF